MDDDARPIVRTESPSDPVTFTTRPRHFELYRVTESEIDGMAAGSNSFSLGLCGIAVGVATTGVTTLLTATLTPALTAVFTGITAATAGLAVFFGLAAVRERSGVLHTVQRIKGRGPSSD